MTDPVDARAAAVAALERTFVEALHAPEAERTWRAVAERQVALIEADPDAKAALLEWLLPENTVALDEAEYDALKGGRLASTGTIVEAFVNHGHVWGKDRAEQGRDLEAIFDHAALEVVHRAALVPSPESPSGLRERLFAAWDEHRDEKHGPTSLTGCFPGTLKPPNDRCVSDIAERLAALSPAAPDEGLRRAAEEVTKAWSAPMSDYTPPYRDEHSSLVLWMGPRIDALRAALTRTSEEKL